MARKCLIEAPPPVASSSDDEDQDDTQGEDDNDAVDEHQRNDDVEQEDGSEEEEEDEEEEEENGKVSSVPKLTVTETPTKSDSSSDTDSDSDMPSPSPSAFTIKPIVSNPQKSAPKRPAEADPAPGESPATKRKKNKASEEEEEEEEEGKKGPGSQRLWSEDDEIAILSGMTRFQEERGAYTYTDMGAFHDFLKKSLHVDVSKNQLMDKIRRLKKKYQNNIAKCEDGQDPVLSKQHDVKSFELSKKVWGNGGNGEKVKRSSGPSGSGGLTLALVSLGQEPAPSARRQKKASKRAAENGVVVVKSEEAAIANRQKKASNGAIEGGEGGAKNKEVGAKGVSEKCLSELFGVGGLAEETRVFMRNNLGLVEKGRLKELEAEWERLKKAELELFLKRLDLVGSMVKLVMDAVNSQQ